MTGKVEWSVFTKPWPTLPAHELGKKVAALGFDSVELPVRDGFQVTPQELRQLPAFSAALGEQGVGIHSVASTTDEPVFAACAEARIPIIRVMLPVGDAGYLAAEADIRRWLDDTVPLCEQYGVKVGIQPHHGRFISDAAGLRALIELYPSRHIGAVWDAAHDALAGQRPEYSLEILWSQLAMVNLKNGYYRRDPATGWRTYFTSGADGMADWPTIATYLRAHSYSGTICLTAEYTERDRVDELIGSDVEFAKSLF